MYQKSVLCNSEVILTKVHMPRYLKGFDYTAAAIQCCLEDSSLLHGMEKRLYPLLSQMFHISADVIDSSIRNAIRKTESQIEKQHLSPDDEALKILQGLEGFTNNYFIAHITAYLRAQGLASKK